MADRDPDEIAGLGNFKRKQSGLSPAAKKHVREERARAQRPEPTPEELEAFAKAVVHPHPQEAVLKELQEFSIKQAQHHRDLLALQEKLDRQARENEKLAVQLAEAKKHQETGGVHYKLPAGLSEEQKWNLMVNDPYGLLGE